MEFEPELQLTHVDCAYLHQTMSTPGFQVIDRIFKSEVAKFIVRQINANPADESEVLSTHRMAKAASQVYQGVINRLNHERTQYVNMPKEGDLPVDPTEGLIDLGDLAKFTDALPNILGGE